MSGRLAPATIGALALTFSLAHAQDMSQSTPPPPKAVPRVCNVAKFYPGDLSRHIIDGALTLTFTVGADGSVRDVEIPLSSGDPELDRAAAQCAMRTWRFEPLIQNGQPVERLWAARMIFNAQPPRKR